MALKRREDRSSFAEFFDALTAFGMGVGGVAFAILLGYLGYQLGSKTGLQGTLTGMNAAEQASALNGIAIACRLLGLAGVIAGLSALLRFYAEELVGYLLSFLGVLLYFGASPLLMGFDAGQAGVSYTLATKMVARYIQFSGMAFMVPGVLIILRGLFVRVTRNLSDARAAEAETDGDKQQPRMYAGCWQTPYCRAYVRKTCPRFLEHKNCWRVKSGCMCDNSIVEKAVIAHGGSREYIKELKYRVPGAAGRNDVLTPAQKRARCRTCVIYEYHQKQKYKIVTPIAVAAVVAVILWYSSVFAKITVGLVHWIDGLMSRISFLPQSAAHAQNTDVPQTVIVVFIVWLIVMAVSYTLRLLDYLIFKLQI